MHASSYLKFEAFLDHYISDKSVSKGESILDVGSASYIGHTTYRSASEKRGLHYVGLDMQSGHNVDVVSKKPVIYTEVPTESHDFIVSGQTFEHNPFFWSSFCEMARILKQGGHMFVVAPSAGKFHRYPFDCWRYYPDSWMALCAISGLELCEVIFEPEDHRVGGTWWRDSAVVARKPLFASPEASAVFYDRLSRFTAPFDLEDFVLNVRDPNDGPVFARYSAMIAAREKRRLSRSGEAASRPENPVEPNGEAGRD